MRKNCQSSGRNILLYLLIRRAIKLTVVISEEYHHAYQVRYPVLMATSMKMTVFWDMSCNQVEDY
jgi:hypothetical protein